MMRRLLGTLAALVAGIILATAAPAAAQWAITDSAPGGFLTQAAADALYCQLTGCTMTGSTTYSGVASDIVTPSNENLTITQGGTGVVQIRSATNSLLDAQAAGTNGASGIQVRNSSGTQTGVVAYYGSTAGDPDTQNKFVVAGNSVVLFMGRSDDVAASAVVAQVVDNFSATGVSDFYWLGGGLWGGNNVQTLTVADNGAGTNATANLDPTSSYVSVACNDANGCDITMQETTANTGVSTSGMLDLTVCHTGTGGNANFADVAGVFNGAAPSLGFEDCWQGKYWLGRWLQTGASNN